MALTKRTFVLGGVGAAILAALAFVTFREDPVPVDLSVVTRGPLEITVNADGRTQIRDLFEVAAPISGTALRSPVDIGDRVIADQTVVAIVQPMTSGLLDTRSRLQAEAALQEALAARHVAQADLQQAEQSLAFAQTQYDRTKALVERNVASITRMEDDSQRLAVARAALEAAHARIEMSDGSIERARASLVEPQESRGMDGSCCVEIVAPADGVVLSVAAISQRPVQTGAPLVSIGDPQNLELVADILSSDAVRLTPGTTAYVDRWGGTDPLLAQLDRIDPKAYTKVSALGIEEQRVDAYFSLISPQKDRAGLGDGFAVFLRIVEWRGEDVLQAPLSAMFRDGDGWAVFLSIDGVAAKRMVTPGRRNGQMTEIRDGLSEGDRVVTHPSDAIMDGVSLIERSQL